jgi:hypothetical protein
MHAGTLLIAKFVTSVNGSLLKVSSVFGRLDLHHIIMLQCLKFYTRLSVSTIRIRFSRFENCFLINN